MLRSERVFHNNNDASVDEKTKLLYLRPSYRAHLDYLMFYCRNYGPLCCIFCKQIIWPWGEGMDDFQICGKSQG